MLSEMHRVHCLLVLVVVGVACKSAPVTAPVDPSPAASLPATTAASASAMTAPSASPPQKSDKLGSCGGTTDCTADKLCCASFATAELDVACRDRSECWFEICRAGTDACGKGLVCEPHDVFGKHGAVCSSPRAPVKCAGGARCPADNRSACRRRARWSARRAPTASTS
jgi:hypothetical protein